MGSLPEQARTLVVIGGHDLGSEAANMAELLGREIIAAGYCLLTGGRHGAGEFASAGAAAYCTEHGLDMMERVFAVVPWGDSTAFACCRVLHAGIDDFERGMVLMCRARAAFIVGGGVGTEHEIMHAAVDDYMAWGTAAIMPVAGTGGVAQRVLQASHPYGDSILDDPRPSSEKARKLVASVGEHRFALFTYWGVNIHAGWLSGDKHPVVRRTYRIRHYGERFGQGAIKIEGE